MAIWMWVHARQRHRHLLQSQLMDRLCPALEHLSIGGDITTYVGVRSHKTTADQVLSLAKS